VNWQNLISPALTLAVLLIGIGAFKGTLSTSLDFLKESLEELKRDLKAHIEEDRVNLTRLWDGVRDNQVVGKNGSRKRRK
jgi:hypothetical protein